MKDFLICMLVAFSFIMVFAIGQREGAIKPLPPMVKSVASPEQVHYSVCMNSCMNTCRQ